MIEGFESFKERVIQQLEIILNHTDVPSPLIDAMRYGVFSGGKRIRPILVYLSCKALGTDLALADKPACAIELIHAYSLIHDDLPAMDNDDLRRVNPHAISNSMRQQPYSPVMHCKPWHSKFSPTTVN